MFNKINYADKTMEELRSRVYDKAKTFGARLNSIFRVNTSKFYFYFVI